MVFQRKEFHKGLWLQQLVRITRLYQLKKGNQEYISYIMHEIC